MCNYCMVCGAPIGENNPDGIGAECRKAVHLAKVNRLFKENADFSLKYNWTIKANALRALFIETFKNTKFRSEFKKSFYNSIVTNERTSKKQLEIIMQELEYKRVLDAEIQKIGEIRRLFLLDEISKISITREDVEIARQYIRKNKI